jgi:Rrf2 family transcriptional regulator, nitric oxide-sensitive transcriptional repressor
MKLQQATRYAIWAVIELASRPDEQILHALTRANIVTSARGPGGGFAFRGNAKRLTLYDIICLFETGWPNEEGDNMQMANLLAGELSRVLHEVDRITSATLRSVTVQTIINNARRASSFRPISKHLSQAL